MLIIILALFLSVNASSVHHYLSPLDIEADILRGMDFVATQEYDSAIAIFSSVKNDCNEKKIIKDFCLIITYEAAMVDYESDIYGREFDSLSTALETLIRGIYRKHNASPWIPFYLGSLLITKGAHQVRFAQYYDFAKNMLKGVGHIETALKRDPAMVDALFYITVYRYAKKRIVSWLPGVDDGFHSMENQMRHSISYGLFSKIVSAQILLNLYCSSKKWAEADSLLAVFREKYPTNRSFLWIAAKGAISAGRKDIAKRYFYELLPLVDLIPMDFAYNRLSIHSTLAQLEFDEKNYKMSAERCDSIIALYGHLYGTDNKSTEIINNLKSTSNRARKVINEP